MLSTNPMAALFGKSPFKPLQQHMRCVIGCVREVPPLFEALIGHDQREVNAQKVRIFTKENEADAIKNELRVHLPRSLLLAVDRRDLLELLAIQDSIADVAQDIAGLLVERRMEVPEGMAEPLTRFVARCVATCEQAHSIVEQLDELLETGFRGREVEKVEAMIVELGHMETDTDLMAISLSQALFAREDDIKPVSVMFWYQLIQWLGNLADGAEKVGDRLRLLIAR
ncbi:TIGR00153 family protein [Accumulibacter sp.]|uniref:TIGR00153 family protein n=1 Tax=Accumulibacter sp. TaxID=2053492 RepID=UPI0025E4C8FF|nr:TIGR00153 family protein [Accumulibacter sp.]MCM8612231.1 TIGR00153 family protein [Accumulibacter sp.]MCM8635904.1 TIGR00153 family protein [Accumulibacter sp.]MCM8639487.1 TIGR00153 family protein [Accumulibacter sp.]